MNFKFFNSKINDAYQEQIDAIELDHQAQINSINKQYNLLSKQLDDSRKSFDTLKEEFDRYRSNIASEVRDSPIVIYWAGMSVVSVERVIKDGFPTTLVSYLDNEGVIQELFYHCNEHLHTKLTEQFNTYLSK